MALLAGRASRAAALQATSTPEARQQAAAAFHRDIAAASSQSSNNSYWRTWVSFHTHWFGPERPAMPRLMALKQWSRQEGTVDTRPTCQMRTLAG